MGTFAETAIVDYVLSFTNQEEQMSIFRFRLQQTNGSLPFPLCVCKKTNGRCHFPLVPFSGNVETWTLRHRDMETLGHGDMETLRHGDMETWDSDMETWRHGDLRQWHGDIKRKKEAQAIFLNPFTGCSSCKRKFVVCPFFDEETNWSYPFVPSVQCERKTFWLAPLSTPVSFR